MQEDVENRTVALVINASRLSSQVLRAAILKVLQEIKKSRDHPPKVPRGKQSVKKLIGQNAGVSTIELADQKVKSFERVARKYGLDFAVKKDNSGEKPKFVVFFKGRDADALTAAFTEYTSKVMKQDKRPSLLKQLETFKQIVKDRISHKAPLPSMEQPLKEPSR